MKLNMKLNRFRLLWQVCSSASCIGSGEHESRQKMKLKPHRQSLKSRLPLRYAGGLHKYRLTPRRRNYRKKSINDGSVVELPEMTIGGKVSPPPGKRKGKYRLPQTTEP